jgi:hypothetical protein
MGRENASGRCFILWRWCYVKEKTRTNYIKYEKKRAIISEGPKKRSDNKRTN